ncbi:hypothetical protein D3C81_1730830 [compost metagenome]
MFQCCPCGQKCPVKMYSHHLPPVSKRIFIQGADNLDPGIRDQYVKTAITTHQRVDSILSLLLVRDIHANGERFTASQLYFPDHLFG